MRAELPYAKALESMSAIDPSVRRKNLKYRVMNAIIVLGQSYRARGWPFGEFLLLKFIKRFTCPNSPHSHPRFAYRNFSAQPGNVAGSRRRYSHAQTEPGYRRSLR
jgi:hypothetical protein